MSNLCATTLLWPSFKTITHIQQCGHISHLVRYWSDDGNLTAHLETEDTIYRSVLCCWVEHVHAASKTWGSLQDPFLNHCHPPQGPCVAATALQIMDKTPTTSHQSTSALQFNTHNIIVDGGLLQCHLAWNSPHCCIHIKQQYTQGCSFGLFCKPGPQQQPAFCSSPSSLCKKSKSSMKYFSESLQNKSNRW